MEIKNARDLEIPDVRKEAIEYCKKWIMYYIEEANKRGYRKTCFSPTSETINGKHIDCEQELKEIFSKAGYHFKPTGYIGGVLQRTIDICW